MVHWYTTCLAVNCPGTLCFISSGKPSRFIDLALDDQRGRRGGDTADCYMRVGYMLHIQYLYTASTFLLPALLHSILFYHFNLCCISMSPFIFFVILLTHSVYTSDILRYVFIHACLVRYTLFDVFSHTTRALQNIYFLLLKFF